MVINKLRFVYSFLLTAALSANILISSAPAEAASKASVVTNVKAAKKMREKFKQNVCRKLQKKSLKKKKIFKCSSIKAAAYAPIFYSHLFDTTTDLRVGSFTDGDKITSNQSICLVVHQMSRVVFHFNGNVRIINVDKNYWSPFCIGGNSRADILPANLPLGKFPITVDFYNEAGNFAGWHSSSVTVVPANGSSSSSSSTPVPPTSTPITIVPTATRTPVATNTNIPAVTATPVKTSTPMPVATSMPTSTPTKTATPTMTPTQVPYVPPAANRSGIGINLEGIAVYGAGLPFKNLFLQTSGWQAGTATDLSPYLDSEGWPKAVPAGQTLKAALIYDNPLYPTGRYMLRFQGSGSVTVTGDARNFFCPQMGLCEFDVPTAAYGLSVEVSSVQQTIKGIQVYEKRFDGTVLSSPFHPNFLATLGPKPRALRFMDWSTIVDPHPETNSKFTGGTLPTIAYAYGNVVAFSEAGAPKSKDLTKSVFILRPTSGENPRYVITSYNAATRTATLNGQVTAAFQPGTGYEVFSYRNREWSERPTLTSVPKQDSGVALELMIQLSNQTKASPWLHVPVAASDDYVRQMAILVKNSLDPSLEVYLEYGNEFWNFGYPGNMGFIWGQANQPATGIDTMQYYSLRSVQIFKIWNEVFGLKHLRSERGAPDRLRRIIGTHTENFGGSDSNGNGKVDPGEYSGTGPGMFEYGGEGLSSAVANPFAPGMRTKDYADAAGLALYFTGITSADLDNFNAGRASAESLIAKMYDAVNYYAQIKAGDEKSGVLARWVKYAQGLGLDLQGYEGSLVLNLDAATPTTMSTITAASQGNTIGVDPYRISAWGAPSLPGRYVGIINGPNAGQARKILYTVSSDSQKIVVQLESAFPYPVAAGTVYKLMSAQHMAQDKLSMHPGMKDLYVHFLATWRGLGKVNGVGAEVLNQFTNTGRWTWHYLSLIERVDVDPMTYPKYQGYAAFQNSDRLE